MNAKLRVISIICGAALGAMPALAQTPPYSREATPDWPCMQRKVPKLSAGAFWSGPEIEDDLPWRDDDTVAPLVPALVSRRVALDDAKTMVDAFASGHDNDNRRRLTLLFAGVFAETNSLRSDVIRGITRFTKNQRVKTDQLSNARAELDTLAAKKEKSPAETVRLDELQLQVQWLQRIYEDRESSTRYICEVPTLLEQRLFAIAKFIEDRLPQQG